MFSQYRVGLAVRIEERRIHEFPVYLSVWKQPAYDTEDPECSPTRGLSRGESGAKARETELPGSPVWMASTTERTTPIVVR